MEPITDCARAASQGEFDRICQILERAAHPPRCRIKTIMRRLHKLAGIWLAEEELTP